MRTVTRRAGPATLPGPDAVPSIASMSVTETVTPSPTAPVDPKATGGRLGGSSSTSPPGAADAGGAGSVGGVLAGAQLGCARAAGAGPVGGGAGGAGGPPRPRAATRA